MTHSWLDFLHELATDSGTVQEVTNGMLFILGIEIIVVLLVYLTRAYFEKNNPTPWHLRISVQFAIALVVFAIGSVSRAWWVWLLWECRNRTETMCPEHFASPAWLGLSASASVLGGFLIIKAITKHWSGWLWVPALLVALTVPIYMHFW